MKRAPLALFRSLWGCNAHAPFRACRSAAERMVLLRDAGFDGVEASLADLGSCAAERRDTVGAVRSAGLELIVGVYASWDDYDDAPGGWSDLRSGRRCRRWAMDGALCACCNTRAQREAWAGEVPPQWNGVIHGEPDCFTPRPLTRSH